MIRPPSAVNSIRQWWQAVGRRATQHHPIADHRRTAAAATVRGAAVETRIAEAGQRLGLDIVVNHLPPGTSKWNKIEHRLLLLHQPKLARQATRQLSVIVELILRHHHQNRPHRAL